MAKGVVFYCIFLFAPSLCPEGSGHASISILGGFFMSQRLLTLVVFFALAGAALQAKDDYKYGPDSLEQPGVPRGDIIPFKWFSDIFARTQPDFWLYVPAQY